MKKRALGAVACATLALTVAAFDLSVWILGALFTLFMFVSSLKSFTERATQRVINYRKRRRRERFAAMAVRG